MITPAARPLEGSGSRKRLAALQAKFRKAGQTGGQRVFRTLVAAYWVVCLAVIGFGLDRLHPEVRGAAVERLVTWHGEQPFPNCAAAHAAGVYDIPTWSRAYTERQDGDEDGLACEPPPGGRPLHALRLRAP
jgi:hypothetical protein